MEKYEKELKELQKDVDALTHRLKKLGSTAMNDAEDFGHDSVDYLRERMDNARKLWEEKSEELPEMARAKTKKAVEYAHDNPWQVAAGAVAIGLVLGFLASRNRE